MKGEFTTREVELHHLPLPKRFILLHPNRAVLVYGEGITFDIGSLCYLHRSDKERRRGKSCEVDLSSFTEERNHSVRKLIEYISYEYKNSGLRIKTVSGRHKSFFRFINYCDNNNYSDIFTNQKCLLNAFRAYVSYIQRLVSQNQLNNNTAAGYQNDVLTFIEGLFGLEHLDRGINLLAKSEIHTEPTTVPDDAAQKKILAWCKCLLNGIYDLVVNQNPYPYHLTVPDYLEWANNKIWVFPAQNWCKTPDQLNNNRKNKLVLYDYINGKLRTPEEIQYLHCIREGRSRHALKRLQSHIDRSNQDFHHNERLKLGVLAIKAFAMLFIAATGMNPSQVFSLPWSMSLEKAVLKPANLRQNFRTIKYRASNRFVSFEIGIEYMPYLRRFLLLRKYLLNGQTFIYMFFNFGIRRMAGPKQLSATVFYTIYQTLRRLSPSLPRVLPKEWRAAKQDYLIRNYDPATAALGMQHGLKTGLRKYSNGSETRAQIEMSSYLNQVENVVLKKETEIPGSRENSVGTCASPNHPKAIADHIPLEPNCDGAQGCLFCDKYRAHADEKDTRKLLSARFCIKIIAAHEASNQEQFGRVFGQVFQRIESILREIKRTQKNIVDRVEREVDIYGILDPLWEIKLEKLLILGFESK
jgi:hypothetical protein